MLHIQKLQIWQNLWVVTVERIYQNDDITMIQIHSYYHNNNNMQNNNGNLNHMQPIIQTMISIDLVLKNIYCVLISNTSSTQKPPWLMKEPLFI